MPFIFLHAHGHALPAVVHTRYELTGLLADAIFPIPLMSGMMDIILRITNPPKVY